MAIVAHAIERGRSGFIGAIDDLYYARSLAFRRATCLHFERISRMGLYRYKFIKVTSLDAEMPYAAFRSALLREMLHFAAHSAR